MAWYHTVVITRKSIHLGGLEKHRSPNLPLVVRGGAADGRGWLLELVRRGQILVLALKITQNLTKSFHLCACHLPPL